MRVTLTFHNEKEVQRYIRQLPKLLGNSFGKAAFQSARILEGRLKTTVPVGREKTPSGRTKLIASIGLYRRPRRMFGMNFPQGSAVVGVWEPHAVYVEYGTVHQAPQWFFRRAVQSSIRRMETTVAQVMSNLVGPARLT